MADAATVRSKSVVKGFVRYALVSVVGIPLLVVAAYHILGWKTAVVLFPLACWTFIYLQKKGRQRPKHRKSSTFIGGILALFFLAATIIIPVWAVATDNVEIMRLWGYAVALPVALAFAREEKVQKNLVRLRLSASPRVAGWIHGAVATCPAGLFLALSETIWLLLPLGIWVWFHAFAFVIFMLIFTLFFAFLSSVLEGKPEFETVKREPPEIDDDPGGNTALYVFHRPATGTRYTYSKPTLAQTKAIFGALDWPAEYQKNADANVRIGDRARVNLGVFFTGMAGIQLTADSEQTAAFFIHLMEPPKPGKFIGEMNTFEARNVPVDFVSQVFDLAWLDDWTGVHEVLADYQVPTEPPNGNS